MMMMSTTTMTSAAVGCYVELHGYSMDNHGLQPDWYRAVAVNGVEFMNVIYSSPYLPGIHTYNVDPVSCGASDHQYFNTLSDASASSNLISYIQSLATGRFIYRVGQKVSCCIAGCNFVNYAPF